LPERQQSLDDMPWDFISQFGNKGGESSREIVSWKKGRINKNPESQQKRILGSYFSQNCQLWQFSRLTKIIRVYGTSATVFTKKLR
jgi:hypothetical protein